jgi:hypothetical protein
MRCSQRINMERQILHLPVISLIEIGRQLKNKITWESSQTSTLNGDDDV